MAWFEEKIKFHELENNIDRLILSDKAFRVIKLNNGNFDKAIKIVETHIEKKGFRCRVYTKGRSDFLNPFSNPLDSLILPVAAIIGVHNLLTRKPDYLIAKDKGWFSHTLYISPVIKKDA